MKEILGYEGLYAVTIKGKIWAYAKNATWHTDRILKPWLIGNGYEMVMLYKTGEKPRKFLVHRLVAMTYISNPNNLREVNHKNGNRLDNRIKNLEWISSKENKIHAIKLGLYRSHEKLTPKQVRAIRRDYATGKFFQREIANKYGTSQHQVSWIVRGKGWGHII